MNKSEIYEKMERIGAQIMRQNGAIISICKDGDSDEIQFQCHAHDLSEIHDMFLRFFIRNKELISTVLNALSIAIDGEIDDDDDDLDGDPDDGGVPVGGCGADCVICMN